MATEVGSIVYRVDLDKKGFDSGINSVNNSLKGLEGSARSANGSIAAAGNGLSSTFLNVGSVIAGAGIAAGISKFVSDGVGAFSSLEASLGQLQGLTSATANQMKQVSDVAIQLGNDLTLPGVSAVDASTAIIELTKSGLSLNDAMAAAKPTLQAAKVAGIDFGDAARIAALNVNAFGLQGSDATKIVDTLTNTFAKSGATIPQLQDALAQSAAVAKNAGLDFTETSAAIGVLSKAGIRGSDAGTSLKTALLRLQAPSSEGAKAMEKYGISVRDASGNMLDLPSIIDNFNSSLSGVGPAAKDAALTDIFGQDAIRSAQVFLSSGGAGLRQFQSDISRTGTAQDILAKQTAGLKGAWDGLVSQIQTLGLQLGGLLAPALKNIVSGISGAIGFVTKFKDIFIPLGAAITAFVATLAIYATVQALVNVAAGAFNIIMALNPITLVVAGIIALVAILAVLYNRFEVVRNVISVVFNFIKHVAVTVIESLKTAFNNLIPVIKPIIEIVKNALVSAFNNLKEAFNTIKTALEPAIEQFKKLWSQIQGPVLTVLKVLGAILLVAIVAPIVAAVATVVLLTIAFAKIVQFISFVINKVVEFGSAIISGIGTAVGFVINAFQSIYNVVSSVISAVFNIVISIFTTIFNFIVNIFTSYYTFIFNTFTTIYNTINSILTSIWSVIVSIFNNILNFIIGVFNSIKDWIVARFNEIWSFISNIVQSIWNTIVDTFNSLKDTVSNIFTNVVNAIKNAFSGAKDFLYNIGQDIINGLINGIKNIAGNVQNIVGDIANGIKDKFKSALGINSPSKVFLGYGQNIVQGLANGVQGLASVIDYEVSKINTNANINTTTTVAPQTGVFNNQQPGGVGGKVNNIFIVSNTLKASESELSDLAEQILYSNPKTRGLVA